MKSFNIVRFSRFKPVYDESNQICFLAHPKRNQHISKSHLIKESKYLL